MSIFDFLDKIGITYKNKSLIAQAFYHASYANENPECNFNNERLEFMGDAVLQIYSARKLYDRKPELKEGYMSPFRSKMVCEKALASYVREFNLNQFLILGKGEEEKEGRNKDSIISDMYEALTGAIYLDTGIENAFKFLEYTMGKHFDEVSLDDLIDPKTKLQEYIQANDRKLIRYNLLSSKGSSNEPIFHVNVTIDGLVFGEGFHRSKKEAEKIAAKSALSKLKGEKNEL